MKTYTVSEENTLKKFTDETYAQASFCFRTLLKNRGIRVNGEHINRDITLKKGDVVQYFLTSAQEKKVAFTVLYEDDNVVAVDKESGVNSEAVFSALSAAHPTYFIHRLDRNTAGVMVFAKTAEAEEELLTCFREKRAEKVYLAVVSGKMPRPHAVEEAYLVKDERRSTVRITREPRGEKSVTEYEVLREEGGLSLLKITLHTGKTHQIRAHLAFLGHPVLGDEKYGDSALNRRFHMTRQQLLAQKLTLFTDKNLQDICGKTFVSRKNLQIPSQNA